jgi:uncharacterized protein YkwD
MSRVRPLVACALAACALLVAAGSAAAQPSPMVTKINQFRRAHGLRALVYSRPLSRASYRYAGLLARVGRFAHSGETAETAHFSSLGEILAWHQGWELRRDATIGAWELSPTHRAVLLNPRFRYVGAGRARGQLARSPATVWVVRFGRL